MAAGRPKNEGQPRKYVVADDVHEWIIGHGGGRYLTDTIRAIKSQYKQPWTLIKSGTLVPLLFWG